MGGFTGANATELLSGVAGIERNEVRLRPAVKQAKVAKPRAKRLVICASNSGYAYRSRNKRFTSSRFGIRVPKNMGCSG
jgi:hypothetical protein